MKNKACSVLVAIMLVLSLVSFPSVKAEAIHAELDTPEEYVLDTTFIVVTSLRDVDVVVNNEPTEFGGQYFQFMDGRKFIMMYEDDAKEAGLWPTQSVRFNGSSIIDVFYDENGLKMVNVLKTPYSFAIGVIDSSAYFSTSYDPNILIDLPLVIDGEEVATGKIDFAGNPYINLSDISCLGVFIPEMEMECLRDGAIELSTAMSMVMGDSWYECSIEDDAIIINTVAPEPTPDPSVLKMAINGVELPLHVSSAGSTAFPLKEICDYCGYVVAPVDNVRLVSVPTAERVTGWLVIANGKTFFFEENSDKIIDEDGTVYHDNVMHGYMDYISYPMTGMMGLGFALNIWPASFDANFWSINENGQTVCNFAGPNN